MAVFSTPSQLDARKIATKPKPVSTAVELQLQAEHVLHLQRILAACVSDSGSDGLNALSARHQQSHSHPRGQLLPHPSSKHETVAIPSKASSSGSIHSKQIRSPPPPSPKSSFNLGHSILPVKRYAPSLQLVGIRFLLHLHDGGIGVGRASEVKVGRWCRRPVIVNLHVWACLTFHLAGF